MLHLHKLSEIGFLSPVFQISESCCRNLFPDASLSLLGVGIKEFTSCGFTFLSSTRLLRFFLCLGKMQEHSEANQRWNAQLEELQQSNSYSKLFGIDGEPTECEWNIFPGRFLIGNLPKVPKISARSKHWTWEFWRSTHLHVNVQWHRLDKERSRTMSFDIRTSQ